MERKLLLLMPAFMMVSIGAFAQQRSFDNAFAIAKRQAAKLGVVIDVQAKARSKAMAERAKAAKTTREVGYYVFDNGNGNGFTIVSGDKRMPDIVGYADRGSYSEDNVPDNLANYLKLYEQTVEAVKKGDTYATRDIAEAKYLRESGKSANVAVSPLLDGIKWNQREPFNNLCPIYDGVNNAATGCAATAMAQVMAYWQYPKQLMEDIPAYVTRSYGISMPSISKGEPYDWANMLPDYSNGYNEEQADAVAKLMAHCGSAVNMDYARESGAIITTNVLAKYFGYDGDYMVDLIRWQYSLTEWTEIINRELEAARPILYSGTSTGGGHEFVCDGSDGNGLYHINWGWGGMQNGYFDITIINPDKGGVGSGNAPDGYNRSCSMIVGIRPDNGVKDNPVVEQAPVIIAKWRSSQHVATLNEATRPNKDAKFSISIEELMYNQLCNDFTCSLAMGVKNADGSYSPISNVASDCTIPGRGDDGYMAGIIPTFNIKYAFPVGTTTVYGIYSTDGKKWECCAYDEVKPFRFVVTATDIAIDHSSVLSAKLTSDEGEVYAGASNSFTMTLSNNADEDFIGLVDIYSNGEATQPDRASNDIFVVIPPHSTIERKVSVEAEDDASDLYVWLVDNLTEAVLVEAQHFDVRQSGDAVVSLVGVSSNATPGVFETENAKYFSNVVRAPKVEDDKVVFTYSFRNDNEDAVLKYQVVNLNGETLSGYAYPDQKMLPGGAVTDITATFTLEELGYRSVLNYIEVYDEDSGEYVLPSCKVPEWNLYIDDDRYYLMGGNEQLVYIAGKSDTGVAGVTIDNSINVCGGKGEIAVFSSKPYSVAVYSISGSKIADVKVNAGSEKRIALNAGIYIVNGKKIVVR